MSTPALARSTDDGHRFYPWKGENFWSVTELMGGGIPKYGLPAHYARMASELALEAILERGPASRSSAIVHRLARLGRADVDERQARGELRSIKVAKLDDRDFALRFLKGAADRDRDAAAKRGTEVHHEAEEHALRLALAGSSTVLAGAGLVAWPEELSGYEASFRAFLREWTPEFVATEATVFNRRQAYAGTLDAILRIRARKLVRAILRHDQKVPDWLAALKPAAWVTVIVDYKAGRVVYPEVAVQLSAYARGEFIGGPDGETELPIPTIDAGAVLHLTPKGFKFRLVDLGEVPFNTFLYAREVHRYLREHAATVLLEDLSPAKPAKARSAA